MSKLTPLADTHNAQIFAIQETKLKEQKKLNIKEFHIIHLDTPNRRGGGLSLLIRDVKFQNIVIPQTPTDLEIQGVSIFGADDRALIFLNDGSPTHHSFSYNTAEALDIALESVDVFSFCRWSVLGKIGTKKRSSWHEICSKIDARTNNSKLWFIAKSLGRDRLQVEVCNTTHILTADVFPPNDDRATANILGSHYQKMSRLTFNKADKNTERQAKLAVQQVS
ncbi:hypothetical protein TNCV_1895921 [Trichonephila clavipes]|nr:hypothetical protein TNCV_1895921 [Trichonephila clavipes]